MKRHVWMALSIMLLTACYNEEELNEPIKEPSITIETELDQYIEDNFTKKWGMAIRYRFVDNFVDPGEKVTPPSLDVVRPMLDFIDEFWINPYLEVPNGEQFFAEHVPAEIVLLGGVIFNPDGTVVLGTADAGAQITFTNVNAVDPENEAWRDLQLQTVYHEFAHTVHQLYKLPNAFETITPLGYTGPGSWFTLNNSQALDRGFVSPYATVSPNEDFAETVAFFLFDQDFSETFIETESDCETEDCATDNAAKILLDTKISAISDHYERVTGVSLEDLRTAIQSRL